MTMKLKCYACKGDDCEASVDQAPVICDDAILCWKGRVRETSGMTRSGRGCISDRDQELLYCAKHQQSIRLDIECCQENLCNNGSLIPVLPAPPSDGSEIPSTTVITLTVLLPLLALGLFVCWIFLYCRNQRSRVNSSTAPICSLELVESGMAPWMIAFPSPTSVPGGTISYSHELRATAAGDSTLKEYFESRNFASGSGLGQPLFVQRTLAKEVRLAVRLTKGGGSGSFGRQVWRGTWRGEDVAVKIYLPCNVASWIREIEVYSQLLPSSYDILGYVCSDMISRANCTELWLVTRYHPRGSLYNYLSGLPQLLNHRQMFNICISIVNGLLYLHTDICGTPRKSAMAHCNITTKNIFVKNNGACVIGDLSHAITRDRLASDKFDTKTLTPRYMSPELLEQTFNPQCLEDFLRADIYSLGLVFWEVCRRCISNEVVLNYAAPYSEWLVSGNREPTLEEMRKLVVDDHRRPPIPNHWYSDPTLAGMGDTMEWCWKTETAAHLSSLRVKKTLVTLTSNKADVNLNI